MKHFQIYTDGACSGNPGKGGYGVLALRDGNEAFRLSDGYRRTTNNRMEILAVIAALDELKSRHSRETDIKVTVYSDSQLVVNTMTKGWSKKTNKDLWEWLDDLMAFFSAKGVEINFQWVKGHADNFFNNIADELAVSATQGAQLNVDRTYEAIAPCDSLFEGIETNAEPVVNEITLAGCDKAEGREIRILLSNGTTVTVSACHEGFEQTGGTRRDYLVTVDIAWRFVGWLHGRNL